MRYTEQELKDVNPEFAEKHRADLQQRRVEWRYSIDKILERAADYHRDYSGSKNGDPPGLYDELIDEIADQLHEAYMAGKLG